MPQKNLLDEVIKYLQELKNNAEVNISIVPPHIEEIAQSCDGQIYGKSVCSIEVEARTLYTKNSLSMFDDWKEIKK